MSSWVEMVQALPAVHLTDEAEVQMKAGGRYSYRYASLPSILAAIRPVMAEHGWVVTQDVTTSDTGHPQVTTIFDSVEGDERRYGPLSVASSGAGAQAIGSAITYARRYALVAALGLAPDSDDDGQAASPPARTQSPHNRAWAEVFHLAGDDITRAERIWFDALEACSLTKVETDIQADAVIAEAKL